MTSSQDNFAECFVRTQGRVYAYIVTLLPNLDDAEEIFQQTSLILWRKWKEYDPAKDFVSWACGIAHFEVLNFLRHSDRRRVSMTDQMLDLVGSAKLARDHADDQRLQALRHCLKSLPRGQSRLIQSHYEKQESSSTVAQTLGISTANLYMRLHRIRRALVECIERRLATERSS